MKKQFIYSGLASFLVIGLLSSGPVYASNDKNPLKSSQDTSEKALKNKEKQDDISNKAKENQPFNISEEAYSIYSESKEAFMSLQKQYGNLSSLNTSTSFQSYLKNISEDKENQELQYNIDLMKQGNYEIDIETNKYNEILTQYSNETKKEYIEEQEDLENNSVDNQDKESNSNEFGKDVFLKNDKSYQNKENSYWQSQVTSFQSQVNSSNEAKNKEQANLDKEDKQNSDKISNNYKSQFNMEKKKNETDLKKKEQTNEKSTKEKINTTTITKNYNVLRKSILASQKTITKKSKSDSQYKETVQKKINNIAKKKK